MKILNGKMFLGLAVLGMMLVIGGCGGRPVVPASYTTFNAADGSFKIDYPAEWEVESGGKSGYAWAKFTSGNAIISIDANVVGSLIADISKVGMSMNVQEDNAPVAAVHEHEKAGFEEDEGVTEKDPAPVLTGLSDARKSEFTGSKTFGGAIHGYRTTALSSTKRVRVVCQCSESDWEALKPAFDKVIASTGQGKP